MCNPASAIDQAIGTNLSGQNANSGHTNPFQNDLIQLANLTSPFSSLIGLSPTTGKIEEGYGTHWVDEAVGQVTGRNAARDTTYQNQVAVDEAKAEQNNLINASRQQRQNDDVSASQTAAAYRTNANRVSQNGLGFVSGGQNASSSDLLGL